MTDEQKSKVAELKTAIEATVTTREGAPKEVRAATVALKRELQRAGMAARVLAAALGVHESTLCRWERETSAAGEAAPRSRRARQRAASFRMVRVKAPTAMAQGAVTSAAAPAPSSAPVLRVAHAPSGLVVDGLDVETLAALLRRMS